MRKQKLGWLLALLAVFALLAASCGDDSSDSADDSDGDDAPVDDSDDAVDDVVDDVAPTLRVAIVAPSASNDLAFTQSMVDAVDAMSADVEVAITDGTFIVDEAAAAIRGYADDGFDLVIAHGSQYGGPLAEIAPDFDVIINFLALGNRTAPISVHQRRILATANLAVSHVMPTLTQPSLLARS